MSKALRSTLLAASICAAMAAAPAQAALLHNATGLSGSFITENFDTNAGNGSAAASQFAGLTFGSGNYVSDSYNGAYPNMVNSVIANFDNNGCCTTPTFLNFGSTMSDVAFAFVSNPGSSTFSAYLGATLVESFTDATNYSGDFYGFTGIAFDSIRIDSGGINFAYILDNLQSRTGSNVPEPASLALLGLGLAGLGATRRRKSA